MRFGSIFLCVGSLRRLSLPDMNLCVDDGHSDVLPSAIHLPENSVVKELPGFSRLRFRNRFGEKIQDSLQTWFRRYQFASEAGFFEKFVAAVEHIVVGFLGVFADNLHCESFVSVEALDTTAHGAK